MTILFTALLFFLPLIMFDTSVYHSYATKLLPSIFGQFHEKMPPQLHLFYTHLLKNYHLEFNMLYGSPSSGGLLNPLHAKTLWALIIGNLAVVTYVYFNRQKPFHLIFFSSLVLINLINPRAWLYSLVWYFPFILLHFAKSNKWGKLLLILPLFLPPLWIAEANVVLTIIVLLLYSIPRFNRYMLTDKV